MLLSLDAFHSPTWLYTDISVAVNISRSQYFLIHAYTYHPTWSSQKFYNLNGMALDVPIL